MAGYDFNGIYNINGNNNFVPIINVSGGKIYSLDQSIDFCNNNVGIGTNNPQATLEVSGNAIINNASIGKNDEKVHYANFSHKDCNNAFDYALIQRNDGKTILNAASNQSIDFRINHERKMRLDSSGIEVTGNINIKNSEDNHLRIVVGSYDPAGYFKITQNNEDWFWRYSYPHISGDTYGYDHFKICFLRCSLLIIENEYHPSTNAYHNSQHLYRGVTFQDPSGYGATIIGQHIADNGDDFKIFMENINCFRLNRYRNNSGLPGHIRCYIYSNVLYLYNQVQFENSPIYGSDDRIKHNEIDISNSLSIIRQLQPQKYQKTKEMYAADYTGDISGNWQYEVGLIAQDLLQIADLSYCVSGGDEIDNSGNVIEKIHYVNYNNIFVYGLAAIKELDAKNTILENKVATLEQDNETLKQQMVSVLSRLSALETSN